MGKFREGRLSEDQVRPIVRYVPVGYDQSTSNIAEHMAVPQLERTMRRYAFDNSPAKQNADNPDNSDGEGGGSEAGDGSADGGDDDDAYRFKQKRHQSQFASFGHDSDTALWRLRAALSPEQGEIVSLLR